MREGGSAWRVRPCHADDADSVVPLIFSSGPAAFRYVFSQRAEQQALDFLRAAFVQGDGEFGHRNHVALLEGARVLASGALWGHEEAACFTRVSTGQIFGFYGPWQGLPVCFRGLRMERHMHRPPIGSGYIAHVAVCESARRRGVGRALMRFLLEQSQLRGFGLACLDVSTQNSAAIQLYEELGFQTVETRQSRMKRKWADVPAHHYMEAQLATESI